jgi:hypothetical protein
MRYSAKLDQVWVENRFRTRKGMTGKKLDLDKDTGFLTSGDTTGFTVERKTIFLQRFMVCSNITEIAGSVGVNVQTMYDHLAMDTAFRTKYLSLKDIPGKAKYLNDGIIGLEKAEKAAFIGNLLAKAEKYK